MDASAAAKVCALAISSASESTIVNQRCRGTQERDPLVQGTDTFVRSVTTFLALASIVKRSCNCCSSAS